LPPRGRLSEVTARLFWQLVQHRQRRFAARAAQWQEPLRRAA